MEQVKIVWKQACMSHWNITLQVIVSYTKCEEIFWLELDKYTGYIGYTFTNQCYAEMYHVVSIGKENRCYLAAFSRDSEGGLKGKRCLL